MQDNFFELLQYSTVDKVDEITIEKAKEEIKFYKEHSNDLSYDLIDYERLIFLELLFSDDPDFQNDIQGLKESIFENYVMRKKLIARYCKIDFLR